MKKTIKLLIVGFVGLQLWSRDKFTVGSNKFFYLPPAIHQLDQPHDDNNHN